MPCDPSLLILLSAFGFLLLEAFGVLLEAFGVLLRGHKARGFGIGSGRESGYALEMRGTGGVDVGLFVSGPFGGGHVSGGLRGLFIGNTFGFFLRQAILFGLLGGSAVRFRLGLTIQFGLFGGKAVCFGGLLLSGNAGRFGVGGGLKNGQSIEMRGAGGVHARLFISGLFGGGQVAGGLRGLFIGDAFGFFLRQTILFGLFGGSAVGFRLGLTVKLGLFGGDTVGLLFGLKAGGGLLLRRGTGGFGIGGGLEFGKALFVGGAGGGDAGLFVSGLFSGGLFGGGLRRLFIGDTVGFFLSEAILLGLFGGDAIRFRPGLTVQFSLLFRGNAGGFGLCIALKGGEALLVSGAGGLEPGLLISGLLGGGLIGGRLFGGNGRVRCGGVFSGILGLG